MDILAEEQLCEYTIKNPADSNNRDYTPAKLKAASKAPVFAPDAAITTAVNEDGTRSVTVPAAQSTDGTPVVLYRLTVKTAYGFTAEKQWYLPHYHVADGEETITFTVSGLAKGRYKLSVTAETAYGVKSEPVKGEATLDSGVNGIGFFFKALVRPVVRGVQVAWRHIFK